MKYKVCIILCYFGKFPETIDIFFMGCRNNPEFNWMIFTDCEAKEVPENVTIIKTKLKDIKALAEKKVGMKLNLEQPYKLCDYKVAYGLIFEDYLKEYDFWGYGDLDVIYGKLSDFITDKFLDEYDKIYPLGHLSLMRNNEECKRLVLRDFKGSKSYRSVFATPESCFLDEDAGINEKAEAAGLRLYTKFDFADIDGTYKRFRNVDKKKIRITLPSFGYTNELRRNYKYQIFYYCDGKVFQRYYSKNKYYDEELSYIHYRRKLNCKAKECDNIILITNRGIFGYDSIPEINEIKRYNNYTQKERIEFLNFVFNRMRVTIPLKAKDRVIAILGKSKMIRTCVRRVKQMIYR